MEKIFLIDLIKIQKRFKDSPAFAIWVLTSMRIEAVLFDMFDTLMMIVQNHTFYSHSLRKLHRYLLEKGINIEFSAFSSAYVKARESLYAIANPRLEDPHFNVRISKALQYLGFNFSERDEIVIGATNAFCEGFMEYVQIDKDAAVTLKKLHGRFKLGIVSNFAIPECVTRLLESQGLDKLFDVIVVSGAINKRKPSPEIFLKALETLGVSPKSTVFVGDTIDADISGAKSIGMKTIYIERRPQKITASACPDQIIKSLNELIPALESFQS